MLELVEVEGGSLGPVLVSAQVHAQEDIHTELVPHVPQDTYLEVHAQGQVTCQRLHSQVAGQILHCNNGKDSENSASSDEWFPQEDPTRYQRRVRDLNPEPENACLPTLLIADDQSPTLQIGPPLTRGPLVDPTRLSEMSPTQSENMSPKYHFIHRNKYWKTPKAT